MLLSWLKRWLFVTPPGAVPLEVVPSVEPRDDGSKTPSPEGRLRRGPEDVVRLGEVVKALRDRGGAVPVEAVAALGVALVEQLRPEPEVHLRGTTADDVLLTRAGLVRILGRPERAGRQGSLLFMSPELVRGQAPGEPSDVYAVCVLLFTVACGRPPIERAGSDARALQAIVEGLRASLDSLRPGLPSSFVEAIHRGLAANPADRFPTLAALGEALAPFAGPDGAGRTALVTLAFELVPGSAPPPPIRDAEEGRVLEAIANGDEPARLVYADLLEERGLVDHARWLRLEAEVQHAPEAQRSTLLAALAALRPRVGREFMASVGRAALEGCPIVFGFRCPMKWEQLRPTREPSVRYCEGCASTVTYFDDLEQARQASWSGACVAIDPSVERFEDDLSPVAVMGRLA
ncbi:MAG: hypothetical protein JNJ54_11555 [Myxococcaceae bacterium]|nr:hypothetical protein [Myxococcaceae bacterium]